LKKLHASGQANYYNAFYYNTPGRTISLLHHEQPGVWKSLLKRFWGEPVEKLNTQDRGIPTLKSKT
jgi:hypothetical protein